MKKTRIFEEMNWKMSQNPRHGGNFLWGRGNPAFLPTYFMLFSGSNLRFFAFAVSFDGVALSFFTSAISCFFCDFRRFWPFLVGVCRWSVQILSSTGGVRWGIRVNQHYTYYLLKLCYIKGIGIIVGFSGCAAEFFDLPETMFFDRICRFC